jgi:hypothetical protein
VLGERLGTVTFFDDVPTSNAHIERVESCPGCGEQLGLPALLPENCTGLGFAGYEGRGLADLLSDPPLLDIGQDIQRLVQPRSQIPRVRRMPRGRRDLERILELVRGTVSDARRIIANLRPTTLDDLGLAATISLEIERLRQIGHSAHALNSFVGLY